MPTVNPEILRWARETAGLSAVRAAVALGLKDNKKHRGVERLEALEAGEAVPSRSLLLKMSEKYRRPLLAFYLKGPPAKGDRGEDFRSVTEQHTESEALVDVLVREVRARQNMLRDLLSEDDSRPELNFIGTAKMTDGATPVLAAISKTIGIEINSYRSAASPEAAFAYLRTRAESAGIFVLLIGNLGSHHTAINVEAFRGFALADKVAPVIVINDQDATAAWSFTLMHELVHLWLGKTGVSGRSPDVQIEKFCNDVAAAFLLPDIELTNIGIDLKTAPAEAVTYIDKFASERHLSRTMVAYSLYRKAIISEDVWKTLSAWFLTQWRKGRDAKRERQKDGAGPNYYVVHRHRIGAALLQAVARGVKEGALTPTRAGKVLGVKPRSVEPLLNPARQAGKAA